VFEPLKVAVSTHRRTEISKRKNKTILMACPRSIKEKRSRMNNAHDLFRSLTAASVDKFAEAVEKDRRLFFIVSDRIAVSLVKADLGSCIPVPSSAFGSNLLLLLSTTGFS